MMSLLLLLALSNFVHITVFEDRAFIKEKSEGKVFLLPKGTFSESVLVQGERVWEYKGGMEKESKLFEESIGKIVMIRTDEERIKGRLSAVFPSGLLLQREGEALFVDRKAIRSVRLHPMPTLPHLIFKEGGRRIISYITNAIKYKSVYQLLMDEGEVFLNCFVHIKNEGGKDFLGSTLSVVVGHPAKKERRRIFLRALAAEKKEKIFKEPAPFFEYYVYNLEEPIDIVEKCSILLFSQEDVSLDRVYVYKKEVHPLHAAAYIIIQNNTEKPFAAGIINVYKEGRFIGQNPFPFLAKGEKARICVGLCTQIICERKVLQFKRLGDAVQQRIQVNVKNKKDEDIEIEVIEEFPRWRQIDILDSNRDYERVEAQKVKFLLKVGAGQEARLLYTVVQR